MKKAKPAYRRERPISRVREEAIRFVMALKRVSMLSGHRAVTDIMSGRELNDPALLKLRTDGEALLSHLGYWRANFHVWEQGHDTFYPWHLPPKGFGEGRIMLPFIDLETGRFRGLSDRASIEGVGGWYDKSAALKAKRSTSRRSLMWLQSWLENSPADAEPLVIIHEGEILLWLWALSPDLLPLSGQHQESEMSSDGRYAHRQEPLTVADIATSINTWLTDEKLFQPTNYRDYVISRLGEEWRLRIVEILASVRGGDGLDEVKRLHAEKPFAALRRLSESDEKVVRVRLDEAVKSGTRAIVIWPVSSYIPSRNGGFRGEQNLFFCLAALKPNIGSPDPTRMSLLRYVIESALILTVPAQMVIEGQKIGGAIAVEAMADTLAHEVKSLATSVKNHIRLRPTGPHELLSAECDAVLCIATEFQNVFKGRMKQIRHAELREKLKNKIGWDRIRKVSPLPIPELKLNFLTADAFVLDAILPILMELLRNSRKYTKVAHQVVTVTLTAREENGEQGTWFSVSNFGSIPQQTLEALSGPRNSLPYGEHGADLLKWTAEMVLRGRISWRNEESPDGPLAVVEGWIPNAVLKTGVISR